MIDPIDINKLRQGLATNKQLSAALAIKVYTLATLPPASLFSNGTTVLVTDLGVSPGTFLFTNGTFWTPRTNLPSFLWADRPDVSLLPVYTRIHIRDIGIGAGAEFVNDGTRWLPASRVPLYTSNIPYLITGTTSDVVVAQITIPGGLMGINNSIILTHSHQASNTANGKAFKVRLGGTLFVNRNDANYIGYAEQYSISNRNSASSQIGSAATGFGGWGNSTVALATGTVDTTVDQTYQFSFALTSASDKVTFGRISIELAP